MAVFMYKSDLYVVSSVFVKHPIIVDFLVKFKLYVTSRKLTLILPSKTIIFKFINLHYYCDIY